jgi:hypothetical protein
MMTRKNVMHKLLLTLIAIGFAGVTSAAYAIDTVPLPEKPKPKINPRAIDTVPLPEKPSVRKTNPKGIGTWPTPEKGNPRIKKKKKKKHKARRKAPRPRPRGTRR